MIVAPAKAIAMLLLAAFVILAGLAGFLLVWIMLPEARPLIRALPGNTRRMLRDGIAF